MRDLSIWNIHGPKIVSLLRGSSSVRALPAWSLEISMFKREKFYILLSWLSGMAAKLSSTTREGTTLASSDWVPSKTLNTRSFTTTGSFKIWWCFLATHLLMWSLPTMCRSWAQTSLSMLGRRSHGSSAVSTMRPTRWIVKRPTWYSHRSWASRPPQGR